MAGPLRVSAGFDSGAERPWQPDRAERRWTRPWAAGPTGDGTEEPRQLPLGPGSCTTRPCPGVRP